MIKTNIKDEKQLFYFLINRCYYKDEARGRTTNNPENKRKQKKIKEIRRKTKCLQSY